MGKSKRRVDALLTIAAGQSIAADELAEKAQENRAAAEADHEEIEAELTALKRALMVRGARKKGRTDA